MKKERLNQEQIDTIIRALESGRSAAELAKENGVSLGSIYMWRAKFGDKHNAADDIRVNKLDDENKRLKCVVADLLLENLELKEILSSVAAAGKFN